MVAGAAKLGMGELKASYFSWEDNVDTATDQTGDGFNIGYDYNFSKRTQVYALYTQGTIDVINTPTDDEQKVFSIGLNHAF